MENKKVTVGMIYDLYEVGGGPTCAINVYDRTGKKCIWRKTPHTREDFPDLSDAQRKLEVCRISTTASAIYLNVSVTSAEYKGPYIRMNGEYY